jgi:glycosyltransferase involved in cell wall biosynthesis
MLLNIAMTAKQHFKQPGTRLMVFDLALGGHHGNYIQYLIRYWYKHRPNGKISIVVLPEFLRIHSDIQSLCSKSDDCSIEIVPISECEADQLGNRKSSINRFLRNLKEWNLFCKYAQKVRATSALLMYLDTCEVPLTLGLAAPCSFSGIYFRPTFHYNAFDNVIPSLKTKTQRLRNRVTLHRILNHPKLNTLFCLDPFAVQKLEQESKSKNIVYLPDPVESSVLHLDSDSDLKEQIGIEPGRKSFLLFGALDSRKGIYQLLSAIALLPYELCSRLCLVLVGGTNAEEQQKIRGRIAEVCQSKPLQVIERFEFISEHEVAKYFQLTDYVLATYQNHIGMSGILLLAAAAGKPVLSSDYGLMGELVRRYSLGIAVDTTEPSEISEGLSKCLLTPSDKLGDQNSMKYFVEQNSVEQYTKTIFQNLYPI